MVFVFGQYTVRVRSISLKILIHENIDLKVLKKGSEISKESRIFQ